MSWNKRFILLGLDGTGTHCDGMIRGYSHTKIGSDSKPVYDMHKVDKKMEKAVWKYESRRGDSIEKMMSYINGLLMRRKH